LAGTATEPDAVGKAGTVLEGPFRGSAAVSLGLLTRNHLAGPRFVRVFPDIYVPAARRLDLVALSRAAHLLVADRGGVLAGWSAAALLGADCAPLRAPAEVLTDHDRRPYRGLVVRRGRVEPRDVVEVSGCRVTSARRTAWDLGRRLDRVDAVVALDSLARVGRFAPVELLAERGVRPGARGCRRLDEVVALADPGAESAMETRLRLLLVLGGLPAPEVQYRLLDEYGFAVARFDLAYPEQKLAIEYDGHAHATRVLSNDDRFRDGTTGSYGWHTMRFSYDDVMLTRPRTLALVRDMIARRSRPHR
jgi:hypothetical protein